MAAVRALRNAMAIAPLIWLAALAGGATGVASRSAAEEHGPTGSETVAIADSLSANRYVQVALLIEEPELSPGSSTTLAVAFEIDEDWHLYWRNPGDSGLPPSVTFSLPPGIEIGDPSWPAPKRLLAPGDILDFVYDEQLTLLFPMRVLPEVIPPTVTVEADIEFLACRDVCIPGRKQVHATWPVRGQAKVTIVEAEDADDETNGDGKSTADPEEEEDGNPSDEEPAPQGADESSIASAEIARRFAEARARIPRPAPAGAVLSRWNGTALELHVAGATALAYFPYESDQWVYPVGLAATGTASGDRLHLSWPDEVKGLASVRGMLEVRRNDRTEFLELDLAVPR
jgi:DsbC/DsbD-like thiol-disulfide interchange protein